jgi:hypothetical protein
METRINTDRRNKVINEYQELFIYLKNLSHKDLKIVFSVLVQIDERHLIKNIKGKHENIANYKHGLVYDDKDNDDGTEFPGSSSLRFIKLYQSDLLGMLLLTRYGIIPFKDYYNDELKKYSNRHSIITVISEKIKFSHILNNIQNFIDEQLIGQANNVKYVLGEVGK